MFNGISLDQAPPIKIPFRMILSAPLFGILGSILIFFLEASMNRFTPQIVAIAHLFFVGFAGFIMIGAIYQMLPVVIGVIFKFQENISKIVFVFLSFGLLSFVYKLLYDSNMAGLASSVLLFGGFIFFVIFSLVSIGNKINSTASSLGIFLAIFILGAVVSLGGYLLSSNSMQNLSTFYFKLLDLHIFLAFLGWAFLLILAISYQVVPMFWVTSTYPKWLTKGFAWLVLINIVIYTISTFREEYFLKIFSLFLFSFLALVFAYFTLKMLADRKRKRFDIVVLCWQISMSFLFFGTFMTIIDFFTEKDLQLQIAILLGFGFVLTLIFGMLYKIVPFLVWFHLNAKGVLDAPMMNEMINENIQKLQIGSHILGIFVVCFGFLFEIDLFFKIGGIVLCASFIALQINLIKSYKIWLNHV